MLRRNIVALHNFKGKKMISSTDNMDILNKIGAASLENLQALSELNLATWEKIAQQQIRTFGLLMDAGLKQAGIVIDAEDAANIFSRQATLGNELSIILTENINENHKVTQEIGEAYRLWLENSVNRLKPTEDEAA